MAKEKIVEKIIDVKKQKLEALEAARAQIDKEFGKGSLMKLGDNPVAANIEVIPSGVDIGFSERQPFHQESSNWQTVSN